MHPYLSQERFVKFCAERNVAITGYSSLGSGSYVPLGMAKESDTVLNEPIVKQIAEAQGKSPAQIVLKWSVQRGIAIIPKSSVESRIKENIDLFSWNLTEEQMGQINALNKDHRFNDTVAYMDNGMCGKFYPIFD